MTEKTLAERFQELAQTLHFAWFAGYVVVLISTLFYGMGMLFGGGRVFWYRVAHLAAAETYAVVVYKTQMARLKQQAKDSLVLSLLSDENVHHLVMTTAWLFLPMYRLSILPYAIYGIFHIASYTRSHLLAIIYPPTAVPSTTAGGKPTFVPNPATERYREMLRNFATTNYDNAMGAVAWIEMAIWVMVFLSFVTFRSMSLLTFIIYNVFLRMRYATSTHLRRVVAYCVAQVDHLVSFQGTPPVVRTCWAQAKSLTATAYEFSDFGIQREEEKEQ